MGPGDFYVDKCFRSHGDPEMCRLYRRRSACERMNSRAERLVGRVTLRGLGRVGSYVGLAWPCCCLSGSHPSGVGGRGLPGA